MGNPDAPRSHFERKIGMPLLTSQEADALSILDPQHQGNEPGPIESEGLMPALVKLINEGPAGIFTVAKHLEHISKRLDILTGPYLWANCADTTNLAVTALGSAAYAPAFVGYTKSQAVVLRNCFVGASAAAVIQLIAVKNGGDGAAVVQLIAPMVTTAQYLTTVRPTATLLSVIAPGEFILPMGFNAYLYLAAGGSPTVDFSCDYRYLPDM